MQLFWMVFIDSTPIRSSKTECCESDRRLLAFHSKGQDPPQQLTYGEFDFSSQNYWIERKILYYDYPGTDERHSWDDKVFCDIGSGTGRLVIAAARCDPGWKLCRGVELLKSIHVIRRTNSCQV
jgi:tRNA G46 methylase TrmB